MSHALSAIVARAARSADPLPVTDGGLLVRFARSRDDRAFAELVRRLGPMVLGVCRRVARDTHLAEDAFQAAFVVLARRAAVVRPPEAVRAWLYGVAVRTAREARAASARRLTREVPVATVPDRAREPAEPPDADALRILDEEVAALPDHLCAAVLLCELDGLSRKDAAGRLGVPEGTLSSRLARARKLLAGRLKRRGLVLPAAGLTALAHATVPARLAARTSALANSGALVPTRVAALTAGVFRAMFLARLKATTLVALGAGLLGWVALAAASPTKADRLAPVRLAPPALVSATPTEVAPPPRAAVRFPKGPNRILIRRDGAQGERSRHLLDPDGKNEKELGDKTFKFSVVGARLAPDGKRLVAQVYGEQKPGDDPDKPYLYVRGLDEKEPGTALGVAADCYVWSRDGTELACSEFDDVPDGKIPYEATHFIVNVKTKEKTALKLPCDHVIVGWTSDKKLFLTEHRGDKPKLFSRLFLMNRDGSEHKALTGEKELALCGRLSPDGGRVLYAVVAPPPEKPARVAQHEMLVLDIATGKVAKVQDVPLNVQLLEFCWSPDGKQIAYLWRTVAEGGADEDVLGKETESHLIVCDPDGRNQKTVLSEKGTGIGVALSELDWR